MGSGGGGGSGVGNGGGNGGGFHFLNAVTITNAGAITANGAVGSVTSQPSNGDSGGGAGGSIFLKSQTATLGTGLITASGGLGGNHGGSGGTGGYGGDGIIDINYLTSYTGTTTPSINPIIDNTLVTTLSYQMRFGVSDNGTSFEYLTANIPILTTGVWHRYSVSWMSAMSMAMFHFDSNMIQPGVMGTKTSISSNASLLYIGANKTTVIANFADGEFNDTRIWNIALTHNQLLQWAFQQIPGTTAGLAAYYKFNSVYTDATANGNTLTAVNSPVFVTDVPFSSPSTRLDIDTQNTNTGQGYDVPTTIIEDAVDTLNFTPVNDPQASVGFYVSAVGPGTGDWTVTVHDQQNRTIATSTITNMNLPAAGFVEFFFTTPWRIIIGKSYHMHLTSTVNDGEIVSGTDDSIATAEYATYFGFLVTDTSYHPIQRMLNLEIIGNERYLATWDGAFYTPNAIAFPAQTHVRCFGFWREFLAIGTWREKTTGTASVTDWNQGRIYFWDGISQTFNFYIDVPEGQINTMFGVDYSLYMFAGWNGQMLVYQGGYIESVSTQANKVKKIPLQLRSDQIEIYPGAMNMYRSIIHFGVAGVSNSTTVQRGVYSWGTINQLYPETLSMDYVISTGNYGNTVSIGLVYPQGSQLLIGWQDGIAYGVDVVDFTNNPAASDATIEYLIQDFSDQKENGIWKEHRIKAIKGSYLPLITGQSVSPKYKVNRATSWTSFTDSTVGSIEKAFTTNPGMGREYQVAIDLATTVSTSPTLLGMSVQLDDQRESKQF